MFLAQKLKFVFWVVLFFNFEKSFSFEAKTIFQDMPVGAIYSIHKGDSSLWLGGKKGIFSITGSHIEFYGEAEHSLFSYDVESIYQDNLGRVWIATFGNGMFYLENDKFHKIDLKFSDKTAEFCRNIQGLGDDVYFSCEGDIYSYSNLSSNYKLELDSTIANSNDITSFLITEDTLYAIDEYARLVRQNKNGISTIEITPRSNELLELNTVFALDSSTTLVGTNKGLMSFNRIDEKVSSFLPEYISGDVTQIFQIEKEHFWIYENGFKRIKLENGTSNQRVEYVAELEGINFGDVYDISVLSEDTFVFSSPIFGIVTYTSIKNSISYLDLPANNSRTIKESFFDGSSLLFSYNNRLQNLDLDTFEIEELTGDIGFVNAMAKQSNNVYFLSSDKLGLAKIIIKPDDGYAVDFINIDLQGGIITSILSLPNKSALFSLLGGNSPGVYEVDDFGNSRQLIKGVNPDILFKKSNNEVITALRFYGVKTVSELEQGGLENLVVDNNLSSANNCLIEDNKSVIWLCTDGSGLAYVDQASDELHFIDAKYTANSRHIRELVQDSEGYFWVMTNLGLVRYDHVNKTSIKLGREDGIKDSDFEISASINLSDDKILVAGDKKNYIINTIAANRSLNKRLEKVNQTVFVDLTVLRRDGQGVVSKKLDLIKSINASSPLEFSYDELLFELKFAANNFVDPEVLKFQYRLVGLNNSWVDVSAKRASATYSTLPSGDYRFEVRVVDPKSASVQPINTLRIKILPPYWQTWQSYIVYVIASILLLVSFFKLRPLKVKLLNRRLESSGLLQIKGLAPSKRKLGDMLHHKELMYANASHEFRTPLTLISGPIEQLKSLIKDEECNKFLEIVRVNVFRLTNLVDQVLELSKIDSKKLENKTNYDLHTSIQVIVESFRPITLDKNQKLVFVNNCVGTGTYIADSLEKIISNLLMNAFKYNAEGGEVKVSATNLKDTLILEIADQGCGIDNDNIEAIFQRFTRLENSSGISGSGLGLAVVRELVIANGGKIDVESELGVGTKFTVCLPKTTEQDIASSQLFVSASINNIDPETYLCGSQEVTPTDSLKNDKRSSVLIVENQLEIRNYLNLIFSKQYKCYSATNGQEGFEKSIEVMPDIIVTDLMMPISDGFQLCSKIRNNELTSHIPIIMLTAKGDDKTRLDSWSNHVDDYVNKPFNNVELLARVGNLLAIRQKISQKYSLSRVENMDVFELNNAGFYSERDTRFYDKFINWLENNYRDKNSNRGHAALALAVSERQLNRKLTAFTNSSFNDLLRKYRLIKAKTELLNGKQITETAFNVGFGSPSYFSNKFKKEFGLSPKAYISKMKKA